MAGMLKVKILHGWAERLTINKNRKRDASGQIIGGGDGDADASNESSVRAKCFILQVIIYFIYLHILRCMLRVGVHSLELKLTPCLGAKCPR